jgi:hypothetical protein
MKGQDEITNDKFLDSRDIEERIDYLESLIEDCDPANMDANESEDHKPEMAECGTCGKEWDDARCTSVTPVPSGRCPFEAVHDEIAELERLIELRDDCGSSEWRHGLQLIREDHFEDYARELAQDIGAIKEDMDWPCNCINWTEAASQLQQDYSTVTFDGTDYLYRS